MTNSGIIKLDCIKCKFEGLYFKGKNLNWENQLKRVLKDKMSWLGSPRSIVFQDDKNMSVNKSLLKNIQNCFRWKTEELFYLKITNQLITTFFIIKLWEHDFELFLILIFKHNAQFAKISKLFILKFKFFILTKLSSLCTYNFKDYYCFQPLFFFPIKFFALINLVLPIRK